MLSLLSVEVVDCMSKLSALDGRLDGSTGYQANIPQRRAITTYLAYPKAPKIKNGIIRIVHCVAA